MTTKNDNFMFEKDSLSTGIDYRMTVTDSKTSERNVITPESDAIIP